MVRDGTRNAAELGIPYFLSYAGFASVFVKDKPEYLTDSMFPTPRYLTSTFGQDIPESVQVLDLYPGDEFNFDGIRRSFLGRNYSDDSIKTASTNFYHLYGKVAACDTFRESSSQVSVSSQEIDGFLANFDTFVRSKVERSNFSPTILGKSLSIIVDDSTRRTVQFGTGVVEPRESNKEIFVSSKLMRAVLDGRSLFENLYTGYNAEFNRNPINEYNRDIMTYLVMYSYVHLASVRARVKAAAVT